MKKITVLVVSSLLLIVVTACSSMHERGVASQPEKTQDWDSHFQKKFKKSE